MWSILTGCLTLTLTLTLTLALTLTLTLPALRYPAQIKRFADHLYKSGELEKYMQLLVDNFNPATIPETMCAPAPAPELLHQLPSPNPNPNPNPSPNPERRCRSLVSVGWDGKL